MLSLSNARGADERESARGVLSSFGGHSQARACFILKIGRGTSPSSNFNVRAWLYYEAGRHADLDLTPLQATALAKGLQMWGRVLGLCGGHLKPACAVCLTRLILLIFVVRVLHITGWYIGFTCCYLEPIIVRIVIILTVTRMIMMSHRHSFAAW